MDRMEASKQRELDEAAKLVQKADELRQVREQELRNCQGQV